LHFARCETYWFQSNNSHSIFWRQLSNILHHDGHKFFFLHGSLICRLFHGPIQSQYGMHLEILPGQQYQTLCRHGVLDLWMSRRKFVTEIYGIYLHICLNHNQTGHSFHRSGCESIATIVDHSLQKKNIQMGSSSFIGITCNFISDFHFMSNHFTRKPDETIAHICTLSALYTYNMSAILCHLNM
jgi:hypothetical protein